MKKLFILIFHFVSLAALSQNLNGYKYIYLPNLRYGNGSIDIYGLQELSKEIFISKGFSVFNEIEAELNKTLTNNPCQILSCQITHSSNTSASIMYGSNSVKVTLVNCLGQIVYSGEGNCGAADYRLTKELQKGTRKALSYFQEIPYSFDLSKTPEISFPKVEKTDETEESIKNYLNSNKLDPIEGIYKSYKSDKLSYYKFGIIKQGDLYKAIIIESEVSQWKAGEVKAIFEQSSMRGLYSVKWYMGDKTVSETFGKIENSVILNIEFNNSSTGEKTQDKFIKMFPASEDASAKKNYSKASGSGFLITTSGIIATNAHVIEGATNIEITISNESGNNTYKTKVLLSDTKNDVALLKIDDDKFKELSEIPYGFVEKTDVGSKVFTIGYPLNDVMGSNYKVTDGIISSETGIADDVRYYQISVPLQPGNSGGPLFNKNGDVIGITSARLNPEAVGTQIENVNYAIKSSYLLNLYNMLPNSSKLSSSSKIASKELQEQIKVLKNYVCLINIF